MTKTFANLSSNAINSIIIEENVVKVVYNSNTSKEYTYILHETEDFGREDIENELNSHMIDIELDQTPLSVGKYVNQLIKDGYLKLASHSLVESK
jgi:hypothetical protein